MQPLLWKTCDFGDKWDLGRLKMQQEKQIFFRCVDAVVGFMSHQ